MIPRPHILASDTGSLAVGQKRVAIRFGRTLPAFPGCYGTSRPRTGSAFRTRSRDEPRRRKGNSPVLRLPATPRRLGHDFTNLSSRPPGFPDILASQSEIHRTRFLFLRRPDGQPFTFPQHPALSLLRSWMRALWELKTRDERGWSSKLNLLLSTALPLLLQSEMRTLRAVGAEMPERPFPFSTLRCHPLEP